MKIICGDLDGQHSGETGSKYSSLLFWVWKFEEFTFLGFQEKRFLLFWSAEFLLGLSPPVLANYESPPWDRMIVPGEGFCSLQVVSGGGGGGEWLWMKLIPALSVNPFGIL